MIKRMDTDFQRFPSMVPSVVDAYDISELQGMVYDLASADITGICFII